MLNYATNKNTNYQKENTKEVQPCMLNTGDGLIEVCCVDEHGV